MALEASRAHMRSTMNMKPRLVIATRVNILLTVLLLLLISPLLVRAQGQTDGRGLKLQASEPIKALPGKAKRYALVIGVDQYADTQITTLGGASNDAKTLANALIQYAAFPSD